MRGGSEGKQPRPLRGGDDSEPWVLKAQRSEQCASLPRHKNIKHPRMTRCFIFYRRKLPLSVFIGTIFLKGARRPYTLTAKP